MRAVADWLRHTPVSEAIWSALWLIRLMQGVHLLAAGVVLASGIAIALRAMGWRMTDESFGTVWRRFAPWLGWSFTIMLVTGIGQTLGDPVREFTATSWWLKMALVLWCVAGTLLLARRLRAQESALKLHSTRVMAGALILGWLAIAMLGRIIAYDLPVWGDLFVAHMNLPELLSAIQESPVGEWMRYTRRAMPLVEATHVLAAVTVFGSVMVVDLRLLGVAHARRAFTRIADDMLPLTWGAFCIAAITGSLMFTTATQTYFANTAFRVKMLALLVAGLNMAFFQFVSLRNVASWDRGKPPTTARVAGLVSVLLWAAVVLLGRWIGFTKSYHLALPAGEPDFIF